MENISNVIRDFAKNESGVTAIEYGLIAALIAVVIISALQSVGSNLNSTFGHIADALGHTQDSSPVPPPSNAF